MLMLQRKSRKHIYLLSGLMSFFLLLTMILKMGYDDKNIQSAMDTRIGDKRVNCQADRSTHSNMTRLYHSNQKQIKEMGFKTRDVIEAPSHHGIVSHRELMGNGLHENKMREQESYMTAGCPSSTSRKLPQVIFIGISKAGTGKLPFYSFLSLIFFG